MRFLLGLLPSNWRIPLLVIGGSLVGMVLFTAYISNFFSYMSDNPATCMNCHVMGPEYATWYHSAHREVATCNDCHVPQDNFLKHYMFKAKDGFRHALIFTLKGEPQSIIMKDEGVQAVQQNCLRCHENVVKDLRKMTSNSLNSHEGRGRRCWDCHQNTPHGRVRSLSSAPFAQVPTTESMLPNWLNSLMKEEKKKNDKQL